MRIKPTTESILFVKLCYMLAPLIFFYALFAAETVREFMRYVPMSIFILSLGLLMSFFHRKGPPSSEEED